MQKTIFIADLHLSADREDITICFEEFLNALHSETEALYILGDLFEVWVGDDDLSEFNLRIAAALHRVAKRNIPVFFIHGNRDFLLKKKFAKRCGMEVLPEQKVINLYGVDTLILHGDELCTRDIEYQQFRAKARSWWWQTGVMLLPLSMRKNIAQKGREKSKKSQAQLAENIMDVTPEEVVKAMRKHKVSRMIHGHTHRPNIHDISVDDKPAQRIVLGDWYEQGSLLEVTPKGYELKRLPF